MENKKISINWKDNIVLYYIITYVVSIAGAILGLILTTIPAAIYLGYQAGKTGDYNVAIEGAQSILDNSPFLSTSSAYITTIGAWIVCLLLFLTKRNRPLFATFKTTVKGNTVLKLLLGFLLGFVLNGACILVAYLHGDISLSFNSFELLPTLGVFLCVFIQSSSEELICRGYLYQKLLKRYEKPAIAIVGNAFLFAFLHIFNDNVTVLSLLNILFSGILFSFMVYYLDSLWCAMAAHAAWNFTQNIIFGLPNSGRVVDFNIFVLDKATAKDSFAYNVGFGIEGTLICAIVLVVASAVIYLIGTKKGLKPTIIWPEETVEEVVEEIDDTTNETVEPAPENA